MAYKLQYFGIDNLIHILLSKTIKLIIINFLSSNKNNDVVKQKTISVINKMY